MTRRFRNLNGRRRVLSVVAVAVLTAAVGALAYWTAPGSGTASGSVGTLNAPTSVSASSTGGSSTVAVSWTASAPANGLLPTGYYVKRWNGTTPTVAGEPCGSPASPVNQTSCNDTSVADGTYTYTVVAVYHSWTAESTHSSSVTVASDVTPPTSTITFPGGGGAYNNAGWNLDGGSFINGTAQDNVGGSGVQTVQISILGPSGKYWGGSSFSSASETRITASGTTSWTVAFPATNFATAGGGDGTYTVKSYATDNANNVQSPATSATFTIDNTAPVTTITLNPPSPNGSNGWYKTTAPTFTLSATDTSGSGVASTFYKIDSGSTQTYSSAVPIPEGEHTISYWSTDHAGNTESTHTTATKVDTVAPSTVITFPAAGPYNASGWNSGCTSGICGTASDATSGVAQVQVSIQSTSGATNGKYWSGSSFSSSSENKITASGTTSWSLAFAASNLADGTYTVRVYATDSTGNTQATATEKSFTYDNTAPTLVSVAAANGKGNQGQIDTHNGAGGPDTLTFTYSDANGVTPGSIVSGWNGSGSKTVSVTFTDGGASNDTITVPGIGTVNLGSTAWLTKTSTENETLTMSANVFVISISTDPEGNAKNPAASNFTWSAAGGTAADAAGNLASGTITTNSQQF